MSRTNKQRYVLVPAELIPGQGIEVDMAPAIAPARRADIESTAPSSASAPHPHANMWAHLSHGAQRIWSARPTLAFLIAMGAIAGIGIPLALAARNGQAISLLGVQISGMTKVEADALKADLHKTAQDLKDMIARYDVLDRESIRMSDLDQTLRRENPGETLKQINALVQTNRTLVSSVPAAVALIESHLSTWGGVLNTVELRKGQDRSSLFRAVQVVLNAAGHPGVEPDGDQQATCQALMNFQRAHALSADGKIGRRQTWPVIKRLLAENAMVDADER